MQYNSLKKATDSIISGFLIVFQNYLEDMPEEEFNKIPVLSKDRQKAIEMYGCVFEIIRGSGKSHKVYAIFPDFFRAAEARIY